VDDEESMRTIMAIVQAEKEGMIESKMIRMRRMEEIREARQQEIDRREGQKKEKVEEVIGEMKRRKRRKSGQGEENGVDHEREGKKDRSENRGTKKTKKVVFA
jgi:60S ribosomal subunit assembly/export protein LOC1